MPLSDTAVKQTKPREKPYKLYDSGGLFLFVTPAGGKCWRFKYRFDSREKTLALGTYPTVTLKMARDKREQAKALLEQDIDPSAEKKRVKAEARQEQEEAARTFKAVALEYVATQESVWAASNMKKKLRLLERLFAAIGDKPVTQIIPADILEVARPYDDCGKTVTAHAIVQAASQVCRYARACGYCVYNAADGLTKVLRPIRSRHRACLKDATKLGQLLRDIDGYNGAVSTMWALRLIPYIPLRSTELRGAAWTEIDLDKAIWTIPATRAERPQDGGGMKMRIAHVVPLPTQAVELFRQLKTFNQAGPLCFPSRQSATRCISDMTLLNAVRRMGYSKDEMCVHGFRGTFSTLLNEKKLEWGFDKDIIEKQLAHKEKDAIRDAYNHADYLKQRRRLMQQWADYLDGLRNTDNSTNKR